MTDIIKVLKANSSVDDYRVTSTKRESYELFFVHKNLETVRSTDTVTTQVTVYVNHDGKLGSSDFSVYDYMTDSDIEETVNSAVSRAKLVFNEPYEIPEGGFFEAEAPSNFTEYTVQELASKISEAVFAADTIEGGSINATEIFIYKDIISVKNSRGADKTQTKYHAMIEAIPTWNESGESVELYENYTFTEFNTSAITEEISGKMREVRDRYHAQKPQTPICCNVILNPKEIMRLVGSFGRDLSFANIYSHSNLHKIVTTSSLPMTAISSMSLCAEL
jgi:predicted Zn-dependent protease